MTYSTDVKHQWIINKLGIDLKGNPDEDIETLLFWIKSNYFTIMQQVKDIKELHSTIDSLHENYNHEVYLAFSDKGNLYVGSGITGRHKHCTSGRSHVLELNKEYLSGNEMDVVILAEGLTKKRSLDLEKIMIHVFKPKYNKKLKNNTEFDDGLLQIVIDSLRESYDR